jgi:hypothetical protein
MYLYCLDNKQKINRILMVPMDISKEERSGGTVDWPFMLCTFNLT